MLGLTGLFGSVLATVSALELGLSAAVLQTMYKPVAKNTPKEIALSYFFLKKASAVFGTLIFSVCCAISGKLYLFANKLPDIPNIRGLFIVFCINAVLPYFFAAQKSLIMCCRKLYVVLYTQGMCGVLCTAVQIILLVAKADFMCCLLVETVFCTVQGVFYYFYVKKAFPPLKKPEKYPKSYLSKVKRNFSGMIFHKLGGICYANTDNLLTSKLLGLEYTALFSNYALVIGTLNALPALVLDSVCAEVSNIVFTKDKAFTQKIFNCLYAANLFVNTVCSCIVLCCVNPFLNVWLGNSMTLPKSCVRIVVLYYFFAGLRDVPLLFRTSYGLFYEERKKPVILAILNLCIMPALIMIFGFAGVYLSELISILCCCVFYEPYILYKHGFKVSFKNFIKQNAGKMQFGLLCIFTCELVCYYIGKSGLCAVAEIVACAVFSVLFVSLAFGVAFGRSDEAKYIFRFVFYRK